MFQRIAIRAALLCLLGTAATASALHGFTVFKVPEGDALNVRAGPSTEHPVQAAYRNGTFLSLTGKCVGLHHDDLGGLTAAEKYSRTRYQWCEIWHDPQGNGQFVTGWAHARYLFPH